MLLLIRRSFCFPATFSPELVFYFLVGMGVGYRDLLEMPVSMREELIKLKKEYDKRVESKIKRR